MQDDGGRSWPVNASNEWQTLTEPTCQAETERRGEKYFQEISTKLRQPNPGPANVSTRTGVDLSHLTVKLTFIDWGPDQYYRNLNWIFFGKPSLANKNSDVLGNEKFHDETWSHDRMDFISFLEFIFVKRIILNRVEITIVTRSI